MSYALDICNRQKSKILTSTSASGFDAHFWLRFALWASTLALVLDKHFGLQSKLGEDFGLQASKSSTVCLRALTRASGFPARFCENHQHWLGGAAGAGTSGRPALDPSTGCGRAPEPGATGQPPAPALPQLCCQWILFYLCIYTVATVMLDFVGNRRCSRALDWSVLTPLKQHAGLKPGFGTFGSIRRLLPIFASLLHHYCRLWQ